VDILKHFEHLIRRPK